LSLQGDSLYGEGDEDPDPDLPGAGLRLLAYAVAFTDPVSGEAMRISLPGLAGFDSIPGAC
jgi:hypothetical protein